MRIERIKLIYNKGGSNIPPLLHKLSVASKVTLEFQGGVMIEEQAGIFELNPDVELIIRLCYWDDMAKGVNIPINNLTHLKALTINHLNKMKF